LSTFCDNFPMRFQVVILAAGQGKRMNSDLPKVLHPLAGKSLLGHVVDTARELASERICVVHGHGGDRVKAALSGDDLSFALQMPQLGTGHALQQALPHLTKAPVTLVLYGDVPLVRATTLRTLLDAAGKGVAVLTAELPDPTGYGRILRNKAKRVTGIVEQKDATAAQRKIREVNTGIIDRRDRTGGEGSSAGDGRPGRRCRRDRRGQQPRAAGAAGTCLSAKARGPTAGGRRDAGGPATL